MKVTAEMMGVLAPYLRNEVSRSEVREKLQDALDWAAMPPVAVVIDDNQPGNTAIVELIGDATTLVVGTELFRSP